MSIFYVAGINLRDCIPNPSSVDNAYENLAIAIVTTAAEDYRTLRRQLMYETSRGERNIIKGRMKEIEMFFKSDYGDLLSFGKADFIMKVLEADE